MPSEKLKSLIALRRASPYDSSQSIELLRGKGPDAGSVPRPNTKIEFCDMDGVYGEWVVNGTLTNEGVFVFFHGGGYYRSSAEASRRIGSNISASCGCRCLTVDYRLAPENPFPAAVEDAYAAYQWTLKQGVPSHQIVVGGSSAGGGLTAALLAKLKMEGEGQPAAAVLLSPWTDLTQSAATFESNQDSDPSISKIYLDRMAGLYLNGVDPKDPLASPVFSDLEGLPPILVQVGKPETMFGDAEAFANKARDCGVQLDFQAYDDVPHAWHNSDHVVPRIPEALDAFNKIGHFFTTHVTSQGSGRSPSADSTKTEIEGTRRAPPI